MWSPLPKSNRRPILTIDAPLVRNASQHLTDAPGSWVAQAGSSDGTFTYSEAVVRLVSADVMLPGDRPGIVTDFVRAHMSCLWLLPSLNCQISSATEHLYLDVMSGGELGCR